MPWRISEVFTMHTTVCNCNFLHSSTFLDNLKLLFANFDLWTTLMVIEQWGSFSVPHLLWLLWSFPRTLDPHTCCRAFSSGAVTTCTCLSTSVYRTPNLPPTRRRSNRPDEVKHTQAKLLKITLSYRKKA